MLEDSGSVASSSTIDNASRFKREGQHLDGAPGEKSEKAEGKEKRKPPIKLRKTKSKGNVLGSKPAPSKVRDLKTDPRVSPVFWMKFSLIQIRDGYQSTLYVALSTNPKSLAQVLAFEEDDYARDVTTRYAKQFGAKVAKAQGGSLAPGAGGKGRAQWWM
ncbi:hypothetical protein D9758_018807 [Tetrapyrgos nigripes]|uniref:Rad4/PNGase transglutaminase-like fold domain-containing protein n=1 Tax=Tetrapyrgos nigripes TaxID=182062 RepID=A0A8H5FDB9_9AGAR|nr:hypothetical protein D9758_018807 [Tetrapyrgos nigripes]